MMIGANSPDRTAAGVRLPMNCEREASACALPLWAALHRLGSTGIAVLVEQEYAAAQHIALLLEAEGGIRILAPVHLNQVLIHVGTYDFTQELTERLASDGVGWFPITTWKGQPAIRVPVRSWQATVDTAEQVAERFIQTFRELKEGNHG